MDTIVATPHATVDERPAPPAPPEPPRRRGATIWTAIIAAVVAALIAAPLSWWVATEQGTVQDQAQTQAAQAQEAARNGAVTSVAGIAREVSPSVAQVDVTTAQGQGEGSAVIYRADGYLITNNHVVENASSVEVTLPSGESYDGTVVGTDPATDIGVIKIDATGLPAAQLATTTPQIGDQVLAIGSPFGLSGTVTEGIISARGRTVETSAIPLTDMLQTDAPINPGNSGGALVNADGEVVGINTAILSPSGTNNGIGFAIPINAAGAIADQLIEDGSVEHGYLGISGQTVDPQVAEMYDLGVDHGAVLAQVEPGSPAADAGLREGDIITAIDGTEVTGMDELAAALVHHQPGDEVTLTVQRDGGQTEVTASLAQTPDTTP